ncbi:serine hydrolase domain-containing protein [Halalkalibacter urbisdiaboli]|uniref:serine hydrolase domain-containing protein n=1 Tax=Halalkalibacter urbisdiaboli TaxID=1960589 RepID=UPI0013FD3FF7|nr:serine hydrolase domain-containing protein [Halalkalibacter urbisdiaboli]
MDLHKGSIEEAGMSYNGVVNIHKTAARLVEEGITPAQVTLAARKGVIVHHQALGKLSPESNSPPLHEDALFPLCSISKPVTATCIMILVEKGLVGLNRPVSDYLPEFQGEGKKDVRIYHLLTHTSGILDDDLYVHMEKTKDSMTIPPCDEDQDPWIHEKLYRGFLAPLWKKPGTVMSYSSYSYELLGEIVRRISKKSLDQFAKENIFQPLGMNSTFFAVPESEMYRIVKRSPTALCAEWLNDERHPSSTSASGGLYSTAMDIAIFTQMFINKGIYNGQRILSPVSVKEMTRNHIPGVAAEYRDEYFPEAYWGLGWAINGDKKDGGDLFSPLAFSHWGAAGVFICGDPVYDTVQIYLSVEIDHQKPFKNIYADLFNNAVLAAIEEHE